MNVRDKSEVKEKGKYRCDFIYKIANNTFR